MFFAYISVCGAAQKRLVSMWDVTFDCGSAIESLIWLTWR